MTDEENKQRQARSLETSWARNAGRLAVSELPAGATNLNVAGRQVVGPLQGFGQLWQKTYRVRLAGAEVTPYEIVQIWKERFPEFQPPQNRFYPSVAGVKPGEVVIINAQTPGGPVSTGVMVLYADDESFTLMTPEGHPESGWITFSAYEEDGVPVAQVQSMSRANDPMYEMAFRLMGSKLQESIWTYLLTALAAHFGVKAQVEITKTCVDTRLQWSQARNIWYNAQIRTLIYMVVTPVRWGRALFKRNSPQTR